MTDKKYLFRGFHPDEKKGDTTITVDGKDIKGKWKIGYLGNDNLIIQWDKTKDPYGYDDFNVIPETIGQWVTTDKNGKDIFEKDIVKNRLGEIMLVEYVQSYTRFTLTCDEKGIIDATFIPTQCKLIGNKWECEK